MRNPRVHQAAELLANPTHPGNKATARAFMAQVDCYATFFNFPGRLSSAFAKDGS